MEISTGLANNIVYEMKKILNKDFNFIQSNGKIIASTDKERIGNYHEGAKKAVLSDDIVVIDWNEQYPGAKKGINIPVKFYEEIIGVIGISGDKKEVLKYGEIIKRMTEILIKEAYLLKKDERENENERFFLEKILFSKNDIFEKNSLKFKNFRKAFLGKNISVFVANIEFFKEYDVDDIKIIFNIFKKVIKNNAGYLMLKENTVMVLLIEKNQDDIKDIIKKIEKNINELKNIKIKYGIGRIKDTIKKARISYEEAVNSMEWCLKSKKDLVFYDEMDLELILNIVDEKTKKRYLEKIMGVFSWDEIEEYKKIFYYYEIYNGSLKKISEKLFIHTNTLQYKLNKFYEKSQLDIRKYGDFSRIKIAFMLGE